MKFDLYKDGEKVGIGNPNMLRTYTDEEIKEFYTRWGCTVDIERDEEQLKIKLA